MIRLKVEKMGCGGCAKSVTRAVQAIEPDARVEVDLASKVVTVSGTAVPADRIVQAITTAGYPTEAMLAAA
ncbi:heavy-metal-associated domain-containing protein [Methylobacterium sp. D48H]